MDLPFGMLAWDAAARPPGAVADIRALPLAAQSVDDAVAASCSTTSPTPPGPAQSLFGMQPDAPRETLGGRYRKQDLAKPGKDPANTLLSRR
jgi:hypothetical protein